MTTPHPGLPHDDTARLREALSDARYTVDNVRDLLGERASAALDRNETTPGRLQVQSDSALETMTRLWSLQAPVGRRAAEAALPVDALVAGGFLAADGDDVRALVDVRPYADDAGDWWVAADLTPGMDGDRARIPTDHVLGLNAASSTLAQLTVPRRAERALDLGTGCGVQALHLARHCDTVVGTDVNPRALALAAVTARLNGIDVDLRQGNLFEPVEDEKFDLIATNPPFVVSPDGTHVYRDGGLSGDEVSRRVVVDGAARLAPGGVLQSLANWMHVRGQDWTERLGDWVAGTGCDAWVIQREVQDPAEYVELWLRDAGDVDRPGYRERYEAWLSWFDENDVEGVGFGWINLRAAGSADPAVRVEEWPHAVEQPLGAEIERWFARADLARSGDDALLAAHLTVAGDVTQEQIGRPGDEDPEHIVLRQHRGLMRAVEAGTAEAGLVGACDGTLPLGRIVAALAQVLQVDADALRADLLPRVRSLIQEGFLLLPSA
ncbi:methyltransferase family protein [Haloactinopolyspora alba]|uniref:Methyltransferase family protein n=1 Tax=Haloactinopolyspora alba TaxID=648780 RepID=A0A2P8E7K5_9ACTN|nr:methyltransferase [Haloactinopolyspora alba]PSL05441.1 methyltransferase family protein [Haloactinopolyspora alba]